MCVRTIFSRHFMTTGVSATGLKSFRAEVSSVLGTGLMIEDLKIHGTTAWDSDRLKISVCTPASCSPQALSTLGGTPSGPTALQGFTFFRAFRTCVGAKVTSFLISCEVCFSFFVLFFCFYFILTCTSTLFPVPVSVQLVNIDKYKLQGCKL